MMLRQRVRNGAPGLTRAMSKSCNLSDWLLFIDAERDDTHAEIEKLVEQPSWL